MTDTQIRPVFTDEETMLLDHVIGNTLDQQHDWMEGDYLCVLVAGMEPEQATEEREQELVEALHSARAKLRGDVCTTCGAALTSDEVKRLDADTDFVQHGDDGHAISRTPALALSPVVAAQVEAALAEASERIALAMGDDSDELEPLDAAIKALREARGDAAAR